MILSRRHHRKQHTHQTKVLIILTVYILASILQSFLPFLQWNTLANTRYTNTNLVVVLVDKNLYTNNILKPDIDRYAQRYIQWRLSDTRAIIFPLDTETIKAWDITKMLENIYHDWLEWQPSTLKWVIIIGDKVPLPVINDNNTFFPSVFPYTDFDDQKYYRDPQTTYFLPNNKPNAQAELRHGLITMGDNVSDYSHFFSKLRQYTNNPQWYIGTGIWYDDLIDQKESFNAQFAPYYLNNFLLAEDIAYHRFNPLMVDFFNQSHSQHIDDILHKQASLTSTSWSYQNQVSSFFDGLQDTFQHSGSTVETDQTPTLFIDDALQWFTKSYTDLYSVNNRTRIRDNILAAWRRSLDDLDSHSEKITSSDRMYYSQLDDQSITPLLVDVNKKLEDILIQEVADKHYALHLPMPTYGEIRYDKDYTDFLAGTISGSQACDTTLGNTTQSKRSKVYEVFFYGKHANNITWLDQTSIFVWSPTRHRDIQTINTVTWFVSSQSIGSSYGVFDQLVEANRWYNVDHARDDSLIASEINAGIKRLACTGNAYNAGYWWNNTPLALTGGVNGALSLSNKDYRAVGTTQDSEWRAWLANKLNLTQTQIDEFPWSLYDIAWSQLVFNYVPWMDAKFSLSQWWTILNTLRYRSTLGQVVNFNNNDKIVLSPCSEDGRDYLPISQRDFFDIMAGGITLENITLNSGYASDIEVSWPQWTFTSTEENRCPVDLTGNAGNGFYVRQDIKYKTIDSTIIHNAPNNEQLSWLLLTTPSRPIDSIRYMTFKWVGGDRVNLPFPNLYAIPVYQTWSQSGVLILKSVDQIKQSIIDYLRSIVNHYNSDLTTQLNKRTLYFNTNPTAFTLLNQANPLANPSRSYSLIDPNIFINQINPQLIESIAHLLYTTNSILPEKIMTTTLAEEKESIYSLSDINTKKKYVLTEYLHSPDTEHTNLNYPWYNSGWYELVALTSDGNDTMISDETSNSLLQSIKQRRTLYEQEQKSIQTTLNDSTNNSHCASPYGEPVPIFDLSNGRFPWFDALQCRAEQFTTWTKLTDFFWLDYKNAQWPVIIPDVLKPLVKNGWVTQGWTSTTARQEYVIPWGNDIINNTNTASSLQKAILESMRIEVRNPAYLLTHGTPADLQPQIIVEWINNIWDLTMTISSTGDNCLIVENKNTCQDAVVKTVNQATTLALPLTPSTTKAWQSTLIVKLCRSTDTNACVTQTYGVNIVAGDVSSVNIETSADRFLLGSALPFRISAVDVYNNNISLAIPGYTINVSTGILYGQTGYEVQRLDEILSYVWPSNADDTFETTFSVYGRSGTVLTTKTISFVAWEIDYRDVSGTTLISNNILSYALPQWPQNRYTNINNTQSIIPDSLPGIEIALHDRDNRPLSWPIRVISEHGLLTPWTINRQTFFSGSNTYLVNSFVSSNTIFIDDSGRIIIRFLPTGKAWTDTIRLTLPDGSEQSLAFQILPWPGRSLSLQNRDNNAINKVLELQLQDSWWNTVPSITVVKVNSFGSVSFSGNTQRSIILSWWRETLALTPSWHGGKWIITAQAINNDIIPAWREWQTSDSFVPWTGLNALYLSLIGKDRGNTRDGEKNRPIENLFSSSPKLLTMTTQIADPLSLHPAIGKVNASGDIVSLTDNSIISPTLYNTDTIAYLSGYAGGSTNSESITLVIDTSKSYENKGIASLEESITPENNVWRKHDQSHLTQFGQWLSVGDATRDHASDMLINIGDPLIMRVSDNTPLLPADPATLGKWPGQEILSSPEKSILKTLHADINNDDLEDIIIVYDDGTIDWQKQYGGTKTFVPMWPLLHIFDTIKDVFIADTAGDWFADIIVQLQNDTLRAYTNNESIFSVDGFPLCLSGTNDPSNPSSIKWVDQWFIKDMDQDGKSDIITNNHGTITITYGEHNNNGHSYISQDTRRCDSDWSDRQRWKSKELTTFTTQIASGMQIIDDSLIHREWLTDTSQWSINTTDAITASDDQPDNTPLQNEWSFFEDLKDTAITFFQSIFSSNNNGANIDLANANPSSLINSASNDILRRSVSPIDYIPIYESPSIQTDNLRYIAIAHSQNDDHVRVYKQFTDLNGDTLKPNDSVKVTVTIEWTNNNRMTYIDHIDWPWKIDFDNNDVIKWRNAETLNTDYRYVAISPTDGYSYIIDNINLGSTNKVTFSYTLSYQWWSNNKITLEDTNNDNYQDIKIYPTDGCSKFYRVYENERSLLRSYRSYNYRFVDLEAKLENYASWLQTHTQNFIGDIGNSISNGVSSIVNSPNGNGSLSGIAQNIMQGIGGEKINFGTFLGSLWQTLFQPQGTSINIHTNLLWSFDQKIQDAIKEWLNSLCNWFDSQWWGIPVPFNMAFLSPGTFNLFGCRVPKQGQLIPDIYPKDKWFAAFWFPGDGQIFWLPGVPLPYWSLLAGVDEFGYFGFPPKSGVIPGGTQIRVYISPTLTMQVGMAICFWPQKVWSTVPSPLKHMAWNCIVTKLPIDLFGWSQTGNTTWNLSDEDLLDLSQFGSCANPIVKPTDPNNPHQISGSPFQIVNIQNGVVNNPFPPGTYFGIVNVERSPIAEDEKYNKDNGDILRGGQKVTPKIVGWMKESKGIVQCVVNDWLDRQVNYMINNLTNMQIGIYLPDITDLGRWFDSLDDQIGTGTRREDFRKVWQSFITDNQKNEWDLTGGGRLAQWINNSSSFLRKYTTNQYALNNLADGLNNPFDQVAKLFENTPLIQINSREVQVTVPMIYEEDISRYTSYLKTRWERNSTILKDWESLFQAVFGICNRRIHIDQWILSNGVTGVITNNTDLGANQLLNETFFNDLKQTIQANKKDLSSAIDDVEWCIRNPDQASCARWESMDKDMKKVKNLINQQQELQNTCYSFLFKGDVISPSLNSFLSIQTNGQALVTDVKENIKVLDQYKRFPLQLYQRVHVTDRYMAEVVATVDSFLGYINTWLNTNASRFEQYVDAILTMSSALETRQAIIDLSVNRQKKCSTCTVDNYDFYACSLGFLCPAIRPPILKLPPLKIPSIYLDLSHIDARMEILLPRFRFTPTTVNLPIIHDLPQPPQITITTNSNKNLIDLSLQLSKEIKLLQSMHDSMDITIPDTLPVIPILPQPPTLPELPSFVPTLNLNLPYLPPAPKIPSLSPEFQTILDVSSFIIDLFCIVKGNIGLVGESAVKTRIEQLTQRTFEIPLFDNINLTRDASYQQDKLEWFDFKLDAYVNFTYNFSMIYDLIQSFADISNNAVKEASNRVAGSKTINTINALQEKTNNTIDDINNTTQQNLNLNTSDLFSSTQTEDSDGELVSITKEKENINRVLSYLIENNNTPEANKLWLAWLQQRINTRQHFSPQTAAIQKIRRESTALIASQRKEIQQVADRIRDYDTLIASIQRDDIMLVSDTHNNQTTFSTTLLSGDSDILKQTAPLLDSYIDVQSSLLDKYSQALSNPSVIAADTSDNVNKIHQDISYLQAGMNLIRHFSGSSSLSDLIRKRNNNETASTRRYRAAASSCQTQTEDSSEQWTQSSTSSPSSIAGQAIQNYYPSSTLSAQLWWPSNISANSSSIDMMQSINYGDYVPWLMLPFRQWTGKTYVDIVGSSYFGEINKGIDRYDMNDDTREDIILRSDNKVWIKWWQQDATHTLPTTHFFSDLSVAKTWNNSADRRDHADDNGYVDVDGINLRLFSPEWSVKNIAVQGESYDSFTISRTNSFRQNSSISGYLIELQTIPDFYHLKAYRDIPERFQSRYILMLPDGISTGWKIMVPDSLKAKDIADYFTGRIIDIAYYNPANATINYGFEDIPRSWYYLRVASLIDRWSENTALYTPWSVWSNHVVAGQQIIADETWPEVNASLRRIRTNTIDDQWLALEWVLNTNYDLIIRRDDPSGIRDSRIENNSGQILRIATGNLITIPSIFAEANSIYDYNLVGRDMDNNISREKLQLTLTAPTISIDTVRSLGSGQRLIQSSLNKSMDQWLIRFQKIINWWWQTFTPSQPLLSLPGINLSPLTIPLSGYLLDLDQTTITGGVYSSSDMVMFYDNDGNTIGSINRNNAEITIENTSINTIQTSVSLTSNRPLIQLIDRQKNIRLFTISPLHEQTILQTRNSNIIIQNLSTENYGQFGGGQCLLDLSTKQCIISVDVNWSWVVNHPYENTLTANYSYNHTNKKTIYTLSLPGQWAIATITSSASLQ